MYYVAYGSNMNLRQMKHRCPNSSVVCNGVLIGWKLVFNVHADIIYTGKEEDVVPVVLWNIDKSDWKSLDMYEGFPKYYIKENVKVSIDKGDVDAVVYVMTNNRKGIALPTRYYFETILTGYKENGINTKTLYEALRYSAFHETEYNQYNTRKD